MDKSENQDMFESFKRKIAHVRAGDPDANLEKLDVLDVLDQMVDLEMNRIKGRRP